LETFKICGWAKNPIARKSGGSNLEHLTKVGHKKQYSPCRVGTKCPPCGFVFRFSSPVRRLDRPQASGGVGEHCSSSAGRHVLCASPGRVAQPRLLAADRGNPEGAANRGRLLFGYFFLAKQEKVTGCRAIPDGSGFDCWVSLRANVKFRVGTTACPPYT